MKNMKKIISVALALMMVLSLCACGSKTAESTATDTGTAAASGTEVGATYVMLKDPVSTEQYGIAFKKGATELATKVKEQLDAMWSDGTFKKIADTWGQGLPDMLCYDEAKVVTPSGAAEIKDDASRKTLTLGFDAEYPPYGYKDSSGNYVGFDIDLAKEVCSRLGWELKLQPIDWDSKDMELNSGNIDVIWNGMTMTGREDDYTWIGPYVDNSIVVVVKSDSGISALTDLAGKNVVTQTGSSAYTALTDPGENGSNDANITLEKSFTVLDQTADYNTAFMNLESGVDDAVVVDIGVANYQIASRNG
jgi:ABC-type amino acid transport substrate-binding protein